MPTPTQVATSSISLECLRTGDAVIAHQLNGSLIYRGEIDLVVPHAKLLWIKHGTLKERKLLDASEYLLVKEPLDRQNPSPSA
jgi:hypothetical protein